MCVCVCVCVCVGGWACFRVWSLANATCNALPSCHLRPLCLHEVFRHYLVNDTIFGKKLCNVKCVFWFSLQLLFETFVIRRTIQPDTVINVGTPWCKVPVILLWFYWKLEAFLIFPCPMLLMLASLFWIFSLWRKNDEAPHPLLSPLYSFTIQTKYILITAPLIFVMSAFLSACLRASVCLTHDGFAWNFVKTRDV